MNQHSIKDTNIVYPTTLPHQVLATGPPEQESERDILQRSRGRRNLQETESREDVQASKKRQDGHQEQRRAIYTRKGGQFFTGNNKKPIEPLITEPDHKSQTHLVRTHTTPTHPNLTAHTMPHQNPTHNITTQHTQTQHNTPQITPTLPTLPHIITLSLLTTKSNIPLGGPPAPGDFATASNWAHQRSGEVRNGTNLATSNLSKRTSSANQQERN